MLLQKTQLMLLSCSYIYAAHLFHLQCIICTILLALAFIAGATASAANAADFQDEYIDLISDICDEVPEGSPGEEICNDFYRIRNSQVAAAVSYFMIG